MMLTKTRDMKVVQYEIENTYFVFINIPYPYWAQSEWITVPCPY